MTIKKRIFGVALLAVAIVASLAVGSAAASGFKATKVGTNEGSYPANLAGSGSSILFDTYGNRQCSDKLSGVLKGDRRNLVVTDSCEGVKMNNCWVSIDAGAEKSPGVFSATLDIGGSKCTAIEFETWNTHCLLSIPPQRGVSGVTVENLAGSPGKVGVSGEPYLKAVGGGGALGCTKTGEATSVQWKLEWTLSASSAIGAGLDLKALSNPATGISYSSKEFHGESASLPVAGDQGATPVTFLPSEGAGAITCTKAHFTSPALGSTSVTLSAEYSGCIDSFGRNVTVNMKTCTYVLNAGGTAKILCGTGESIEYRIESGGSTVCTVQVPPQVLLSSVSYTTTGSGSESGIEVNLNLGSLETTTSGGFFNCGVSNG